ncbi:MAG TPA: Xaa-Pro peptidase family protein [Thermomicrobiales bacterium]|nr:Xaa-Pro peptidase family protein [Thermomicrobiales bacterium]
MAFVPQSVFADREKRIKEWLDANGLKALIVTTPLNFYMVSGFHLDVEPWERPVAAVIPVDGDPFMIMNELSTNHLRFAEERKSLYITDYTIYTEHPRLTNRTWDRNQWGELLASRLAERGVIHGTVAVEGGAPKALAYAAPKLTYEDATSFLIGMRMVKYPEELDIMRECAALTDWGQDRYMEHVKPGLNVKAFDLQIGAMIMEEAGKRFPDDHFEVFTMALSGKASASPHGTGADAGETFEKGDGVVNIIVCRLSGLVVENERTLFVGKPRDDLQIRAYEAAADACQAAAAQMVAGNPVASADAAAQQVYEKAGFGEYINHRTGHGLGIGGHEFPEDMPYLHRPFMEREVYSAEPGIYIWGVGGFRHDDTVIVGKDAPEVITRRSLKLEDQIVDI